MRIMRSAQDIPSCPSPRGPVRAVVADDDPVYRALLEAALGTMDVHVISKSRGDNALEAIEADESVRIAVVNWMMPGLDGHEICRRLAAEPVRRVYALLMVGAAFRDQAAELLALKADDCLAKPFGEASLKRHLRRALDAVRPPRR